MTSFEEHSAADLVATPEIALTGEGVNEIELGPRGKRFESLHFALRNTKLVIGSCVVLAFLALAIVGPWLTDATRTGSSTSR